MAGTPLTLHALARVKDRLVPRPPTPAPGPSPDSSGSALLIPSGAASPGGGGGGGGSSPSSCSFLPNVPLALACRFVGPAGQPPQALLVVSQQALLTRHALRAHGPGSGSPELDPRTLLLDSTPVSQWDFARRAGQPDLRFVAPPPAPAAPAPALLAQVELATHPNPARPLWAGPQFLFKPVDPARLALDPSAPSSRARASALPPASSSSASSSSVSSPLQPSPSPAPLPAPSSASPSPLASPQVQAQVQPQLQSPLQPQQPQPQPQQLQPQAQAAPPRPAAGAPCGKSSSSGRLGVAVSGEAVKDSAGAASGEVRGKQARSPAHRQSGELQQARSPPGPQPVVLQGTRLSVLQQQ